MTGTVDTEKGESPLQAAVREIEEETNVKVNPENSCFVGNGWTNCFRDKTPDSNHVFAFVVDEKSQDIKAQASELRQAEWRSLQTFLEEPLISKPQFEGHDKVFIYRSIVEAAAAKVFGGSWSAPQTRYWGSGKKVEFCS